MQYFEMPPRRVLTGQIPGELEYEIWANDKDEVFINKTRDVVPEEEDPNIIVIKTWIGDRDE